MTKTKAGHFLVVPVAMWGHVRPILHLSLNILIEHPALHLSLLVANSVRPRVEQEIASASFTHLRTVKANSDEDTTRAQTEGALLDRLQIIHVASEEWTKAHPTFDASVMVDEAAEYAKILPAVLTALSQGEGYGGQANKFGNTKPDFLIFDAFQSFVPSVAREVAATLDQKVLPLIAFAPSNAAACFHHFAKSESGGFLNLTLDHVKADIAKGVPEDEAWAKNAYFQEGKVQTIPGLGTMYDYELFPQNGAMPVPVQATKQIVGMLDAANDKDTVALILPTVEELEPVTHKALEEELGKPVLQAGLQFPEDTWRGVALARDIHDMDQKRVLAFLDEQINKRGPRSVAYVSFGSAFFPIGRLELATFLVESLREADVPFIFAYATEIFPVPPDLIALVEANPNACAIRFAPQWHVLEHPATRWFVSHCGSNSTAEAIVAGVPLVSHPFGADQAEFTAMLERLGVTIDLKQVKTFRDRHSMTKLYAGGEVIGTEAAIKEEQQAVWKQMMGVKGDELRDNMLKVRDIAAKSRERGKAKEAMQALAQFY